MGGRLQVREREGGGRENRSRIDIEEEFKMNEKQKTRQNKSKNGRKRSVQNETGTTMDKRKVDRNSIEERTEEMKQFEGVKEKLKQWTRMEKG